MNILLGITGGIAAYKTPDLVRRLRERGADVQVVMTRSAAEFVTETALAAVSGKPVRSTLWDHEAEAAMGHIELARWADQVLVAPATAEFISRLAQGSASDLLSTLCLATRAPIAIAPAMNNVMWDNPAVVANRDTLEQRGVRLLGPASGEQACGEIGPGRMLEPVDIADAVIEPPGTGSLHGRTVLITAGPTREPIDPVRYITNRSSGKMGYAMAAAARAAGAKVILVSGPVALAAPAGVETVPVSTATEMFEATLSRIDGVDIFIGAAAVADYQPATLADHKIKKSADTMQLELTKTRDILASVAALPTAPFAVGFAAETQKLREHAMAKFKRKNLDMIIANRVGDQLAFDCDENCVEVYWHGGEAAFEKMAKRSLATELVELVARQFASQNDRPSPLSVIASKD
ncbi:MAG: bifunctional phosphopantothenoylcysteine decarboxylase/phosphopantothenate--cysteine ligase CoaBC [Pseudomonadota bacterium]